MTAAGEGIVFGLSALNVASQADILLARHALECMTSQKNVCVGYIILVNLSSKQGLSLS